MEPPFVRDFFALAEEWELDRKTGAALLAIIVMAKMAGCRSADEARAWSYEEGLTETVSDGQDRVTEYGFWAACVWAHAQVGDLD